VIGFLRLIPARDLKKAGMLMLTPRRVVLLGCVGLLTLIPAACGGSAGNSTLTVINGAGGALCSVRIKKASSQTFWGRNRLSSGERLEPGTSLTLALADGYYDADAHLCDDDAHPGFLRYDIQVAPEVGVTWVVGEYQKRSKSSWTT